MTTTPQQILDEYAGYLKPAIDHLVKCLEVFNSEKTDEVFDCTFTIPIDSSNSHDTFVKTLTVKFYDYVRDVLVKSGYPITMEELVPTFHINIETQMSTGGKEPVLYVQTHLNYQTIQHRLFDLSLRRKINFSLKNLTTDNALTASSIHNRQVVIDWCKAKYRSSGNEASSFLLSHMKNVVYDELRKQMIESDVITVGVVLHEKWVGQTDCSYYQTNIHIQRK